MSVHHNVLSLGAGVQSTVLALLLEKSRVGLRKLGYPKPNYAIFADTGWEPDYVYEHVKWLRSQLSYEVYVVQAANIRKRLRRGMNCNGRKFVDIPLFTLNEGGKKGMLWRQCTTNYKIKPIHRKVREMLGAKRGRPVPQGSSVSMLIGLSIDEATRMKPSRDSWIEHRWPLIDLGMSREDCLDWFEKRYSGRYLPRSACVICPFRSDAQWLEMKEQDPDAFDEAVRFDQNIRRKKGPMRRLLNGMPYVHSSRRPLATAIDMAELKEASDTNYFENECEGMCGV